MKNEHLGMIIMAVSILLILVLSPLVIILAEPAIECDSLLQTAIAEIFIEDPSIRHVKGIFFQMLEGDCEDSELAFYIYRYLKTGNEKYMNILFDSLDLD